MALSQALLDELWDFGDPAGSEVRLRTAAEAETDTATRAELATQVARALGLQERYAAGPPVAAHERDVEPRVVGIHERRGVRRVGRLEQQRRAGVGAERGEDAGDRGVRRLVRPDDEAGRRTGEPLHPVVGVAHAERRPRDEQGIADAGRRCPRARRAGGLVEVDVEVQPPGVRVGARHGVAAHDRSLRRRQRAPGGPPRGLGQAVGEARGVPVRAGQQDLHAQVAAGGGERREAGSGEAETDEGG